MFSYFPMDLFIEFERFFIPDEMKMSSLSVQTYLRIYSWILLVVFGASSIYYTSEAIYTDIVTGPLTEVMAQTIVKAITGILALAPTITYLLQVNAYAPYL